MSRTFEILLPGNSSVLVQINSYKILASLDISLFFNPHQKIYLQLYFIIDEREREREIDGLPPLRALTGY